MGENLFCLCNPFYLDSVELIGKVKHTLGSYESALNVFDDCLDKRQDLLQKKRAKCATLFVDIEKHRENIPPRKMNCWYAAAPLLTFIIQLNFLI